MFFISARILLFYLHAQLFGHIAGTVIRDDMGFTLEKAGKEVLGSTTRVMITKDCTLIVTDESTQAAVQKRVSQIRNLVEVHLPFTILPLALHYCSISQLSQHQLHK